MTLTTETREDGMMIEFRRKDDETDVEWAAACKDLARAYAIATEHLLPPQDRGSA